MKRRISAGASQIDA